MHKANGGNCALLPIATKFGNKQHNIIFVEFKITNYEWFDIAIAEKCVG